MQLSSVSVSQERPRDPGSMLNATVWAPFGTENDAAQAAQRDVADSKASGASSSVDAALCAAETVAYKSKPV